MSMSVSDKITEQDISFSMSSLISNKSNWVVDSGVVELGDTIKMGANSRCSMTITKEYSESFKCEYLKLLARLNSDDKTLSTENTHRVCVVYTIKYKNDEGEENTVIDCFYPRYVFENNFVDDYSIISVPENAIISVHISIINNESEQVFIEKTGLYYKRVITEESISDTSTKAVEKALEDGTMYLVIPLVQTLPDINSVPDGYICRLATMDALDV